MAATAIALQLRPRHRAIRSPSFVQLFSSSTSDPNAENQTTSPSPSQPESQLESPSYFSDVKASLKRESSQQWQPRKPISPPSSPPRYNEKPSKIASLEEIRKNLTEFRRRSAVPPPGDRPSSPSSQTISFEELYKRNVIAKGEQSSNEKQKGGNLSFDAIRESLRKMRSTAAKNQLEGRGKVNETVSLSKFKESLKLRPVDPNAKESPVVIGGTDTLPISVFGKEMKDKKEADSSKMNTEFLKIYSYGELGEKLRMLRPETKRKNWFSLGELNERLAKLREIEEKESQSRTGGVNFKDLRESLARLQMSDDQKARKSSIHRLDILGQLGGTPNFMLAPPKEQLVEKYFHPDNMSSSEKLKLELEKVREEFKMSESDCGSARVQVALLTTKIKHLANVLQKKDKHSRKGLEAMVQRRKKWLKYLRRTDWDSYCLVLSKLGLRDNPGYKT